MAQLPKELNYIEGMASIPDTTRTIRMVVAPSNVSSVTNGSQQIIFDLPDSNGYIVPGTLKINYSASVTVTGVTAKVKGVPAYTFFNRCDTYVQQGSQLIEGIAQYGALCDKLYATKLTMSHKLGNAVGLGLLDNATTPTNVNLNGRVLATGANTFSLSAPLGCIISNCDKLVPARCGFRIVLTTEELAQAVKATGDDTVDSFELTNLELAYDMVEFNSPEIDAAVMGMNDGQVVLKSQSYSLTSQSLAAGANGTQTLTFNNRFSSIKSLFAVFGGDEATQLNGSYYDSVDITSGGGSYVFEIGGKQFPERPLSAKNNKSAIFSALADCWGGNSHSLYNESMSILPVEFARNEATVTTVALPGRFYVGQNVERLQTSAMVTGVSSLNTAINLRMDIPTATTLGHQVSLICLYDSILTIDLMSKQASVRV